MTTERRSEDRIKIGIERGLADIDLGRFREFTPPYAKDMAAEFKARLWSGHSDHFER